MRAFLRFSSALAVGLAVGACNLVNGASDLEVAPEGVIPSPSTDAGLRDAPTTVPPRDDASTTDAASDASVPATDAGCTATAAPTSILGSATALKSAVYELTPETFALAGGIASATPIPIDDFDASFSYSITYTNGTNPGAGLAFFAISSPTSGLSCQPGPHLCTLGAASPGFAVILRTSKASASDPAAPYVAVVDAQTFPGTQPTTTTSITAPLAYTLVATQPVGLPDATTFHLMSIAARSGKVSVTIDGSAVLKNVPIPGWSPGRTSTWGIGAATGLGNTFAERTVVGTVSFASCPAP